PHAPGSPCFPYTTLFRSQILKRVNREMHRGTRGGPAPPGGVRLLVRHPWRSPPTVPHWCLSRFMIDRVRRRDRPLPRGVIMSRKDRKSTRLNSSHVSISY